MKDGTAPTSLSLALVEAQRAIKPVTKGATNQHHRYKYVSADTMVEEARSALNGADLALSRTSVRVVDGQVPMLLSTYRLEHGSSGESRDYLDQPWPILEGNGRPFDKALAGSLTTSLSYFLRDLLLIPRDDEAEIDKRDDRSHSVEVIGIAGAGAVRRKVKAAGLIITDLTAAMQKAGIDPPQDLADWPRGWLVKIEAWISRSTSEQKEATPAVE